MISSVVLPFRVMFLSPFEDNADLLLGREVPPGGSPDVPDGLLRALRSLLVALSHRVPPWDYDEPEPISYAISSICPVGPDGEHIAAELGPKGIRTHAISPGSLKTRAASGIGEFDKLLQRAQSKASSRSLVSIEDVGRAVAFLALDGAKLITGETIYIDGGYHIID